MKICIYGAGAIGGVMATRLVTAGETEVSLVARGAHLAAIRAHGLTMESRGQAEEATEVVRPAAATDDSRELPPQDFVAVTLKAHSLPEHAGRIAGLLAPGGVAVFVLNGIPWWWEQGLADRLGRAPATLPLMDPSGALWRTLVDRTVGCVVYCEAEVRAPGVVLYSGYNQWIVGEPSNAVTERVTAFVDVLQRAGVKGEASSDIRMAVWKKLLRNAAANPVAALTRLTAGGLQRDEAVREVMAGLVRDTAAVADACGWNVDDDVASFLAYRPPNVPLRPLTGGRPSMLQDVLAGRPMEVDAILGQTHAFGRALGVPTPTLDVVLPLARGLNRAISG